MLHGEPDEIVIAAQKLLESFAHVLQSQPLVEREHKNFLQRMDAEGWFEGGKLMSLFKVLSDLCIHVAVQPLFSQSQYGGTALQYMALDAYIRLLAVLSRASPLVGLQPLRCACETMNSYLLEHGKQRGAEYFNGRPYFRFYLGLLHEFDAAVEEEFEENSQLGMRIIAQSLLKVQPLEAPLFAFFWWELVSDSKLVLALLPDRGEGMKCFHDLVLAALAFLEPALQATEVMPGYKCFFQGVVRVFVGLLHDYPEYLSEYALELCSVIPVQCHGLRNLVLTAFPRNVQLPNPKLQMDQNTVDETRIPPVVSGNIQHMLHPAVRAEVDQFIANRQLGSYLSTFSEKLTQTLRVPGGSVAANKIIAALLLYTVNKHATTAIETAAELFRRLLADMDFDGRYYFLNGMFNHLRYPNLHTLFFTQMIWWLCGIDSCPDAIKEQILRIMLERFCQTGQWQSRMHPWGILFTLHGVLTSNSLLSQPYVRENKAAQAALEGLNLLLQQRSGGSAAN
eukprot:jgi/Botrbrau1/4884/Bobra.0032s0039.1